jgi:hypothetical protein
VFADAQCDDTMLDQDEHADHDHRFAERDHDRHPGGCCSLCRAS